MERSRRRRCWPEIKKYTRYKVAQIGPGIVARSSAPLSVTGKIALRRMRVIARAGGRPRGKREVERRTDEA